MNTAKTLATQDELVVTARTEEEKSAWSLDENECLKREERYQDMAESLYGSDDISFDDDPDVVHGEYGAWVQALGLCP